jgi:ribonuclease G
MHRTVGNIYVGRVEAVLPGMQAAFVDIGLEKSAFLHASDLIEPDEDDDDDEGPSRPRRGRNGRSNRNAPNIDEHLSKGQEIVVQVTKEPISTKGSRVTAQVSIPGRFLVYMPSASKIGVSRKIASREERGRLRSALRELVPEGSGGVIVRTVAEDLDEDLLKRELKSQLEQWRRIEAKQAKVQPPALLHEESSLTSGIIRDLFSDKVDSLHVDSPQLFGEIKKYLRQVDPSLVERVKLHKSGQSLFDAWEIESEIHQLFKGRVDMPTGGYVIIEQTEALVSIDVNTGRYTGKKDPEKTILRTNLEAAREVARQLRLRDVGGIIVIDFIDMETQANRDKIVNELRSHLVRDRARTRVYDVSDLGLVEMTRQRVRPSLIASMTGPCSGCMGQGRVFRPEVVVRHLDRSMRRVANDERERQVLVRLHPEVALYLLEDEPEFVNQIKKTTRLEVELRDDPTVPIDAFRLVSQPAGRDVTEKYVA